jgi:hypothetical protein
MQDNGQRAADHTATYRRITAASDTKPCGGAGQRPNDAIGGMHDEFAIGVLVHLEDVVVSAGRRDVAANDP